MDINSINTLAGIPSTQGLAEGSSKVDSKVPVETSVVSPESIALEDTPEALGVQVENLNKILEQLGQSITFGVDKGTQSSVVKVVDKTTDELIKQYPSEGSLRMMKNIQEYLERAQQSGGLTKEGLTGSLFNEII